MIELKKHGELNIDDVKHDTPICCIDSEGNLFPSFAYAARFHNVSPSTASSCWCQKTNFRSKHYNKKVSICSISEEEYVSGNVRPELIELVTRRAAGEHIYATFKNPGNPKDKSLIIKDAVWVNYPYWKGWYREEGDTFTF